MNKALLSLAFILLFSPFFNFGQTTKLVFKYETKQEITKKKTLTVNEPGKELGVKEETISEIIKTKTVIFTIVGKILNFEKSTKLISLLSATEGVISFKIFYNRRCKVELLDEKKYDAQYLRSILNSEDVDYDIDYVIVNDKIIESDLLDRKELYPYNYNPAPVENYQTPKNFPSLINTGDSEKDKILFSQAKQNWIEENPDAYKAMIGIEYLDYSQKLQGKK
ncbi:MAG: hypothetical protein HXX09_06210 [Bacteroidetes bacterium]|nr:hypothetical protein [Bacteroidota bacterium]